jgi:hypothetical protein
MQVKKTRVSNVQGSDSQSEVETIQNKTSVAMENEGLNKKQRLGERKDVWCLTGSQEVGALFRRYSLLGNQSHKQSERIFDYIWFQRKASRGKANTPRRREREPVSPTISSEESITQHLSDDA